MEWDARYFRCPQCKIAEIDTVKQSEIASNVYVCAYCGCIIYR